MPPKWASYQEEAAAFFQSIGLNAELEKPVKGVRGKHKIDVYIEGAYIGIAFKRVVECKCWTSNVPKEKVMALRSIIDEIGADRDFLLSEKGFQSGAIRVASASIKAGGSAYTESNPGLYSALGTWSFSTIPMAPGQSAGKHVDRNSTLNCTDFALRA